MSREPGLVGDLGDPAAAAEFLDECRHEAQR
jgi:hypothetical protein